MDAFIAAMGQFSISASVQLQRRTFEFAMRNGYNMQCAHATQRPLVDCRLRIPSQTTLHRGD